MSITAEQIEAGQAVYSQKTLRLYDFIVLGISNRFLWKCPTKRLEQLYAKHVTANHLDVGVGSGYFLDHCPYPAANPRIALMDLNNDALEYSARRIARYQPERYQRNVLEPITLEAAKFDSVGINYLLHCIPGTIESKSAAFDHLKALMNPGAVLFGATILHDGVNRNWGAKQLMAAYNKKGIFNNTEDHLEGLQEGLNRRFNDVTVEISGCVALFSGRV